MSLLTPKRVPVKVYRWDDDGAPVLNQTANCAINVFKACLVTGYGSKAGAGWTEAFQGAGVSVLRPEVSANTDFFLRLSADTGTEVKSQVYLNMTDANTGDLKLQCGTEFAYAKRNSTGKWLMIASPRGVWFFNDQRFNDGAVTKTGAFFYAGDIQNPPDTDDAVYLQHSGGTFKDGAGSDIFGRNIGDGIAKTTGQYLKGALLVGTDTVITIDATSIADLLSTKTTVAHLAPLLIVSNGNLYILPGAYAPLSNATKNNFDTIIASTDTVSNMIVHGTGGRNSSNLYIDTDAWSY